MKQKSLLIFISSILCMNLHAQDIPNAANFLPGPPSTLSMKYVNDFADYSWGIDQRSTSRGTQAKSDMGWDLDDFLPVYSSLLGVNITKNNTPNIYQVLEQLKKYADLSIELSRNSYYNKRPYARFDEESLMPDTDDKYANVSCYPSEQATYGWLLSMLMVEICPDKQDEILKRGYEFGESSIIAGYSWYSDTQIGRDLASALMIYIHAMGGFNQLIKMARDEYNTKSSRAGTRSGYLTYESLPNPVKYLPAPPEDQSVLFAYDMNQYNEGRSKRTTDRGKQAKNDCDDSMDYICSIFSTAFGRTISESNTPEIYELIHRVRDLANQSCTVAKEHYNRVRPYVRFHDSTIYPDAEADLANNGSYPSGHAAFGWLIGLTLSEINPSQLSAIMNRAYEYGMSRVIAGYHFQSDVDAGRLTAGAAFARLHIESEFLDQLDKAIKEFKGGSSGVRGVTADEAASSAPIYTLGGVRLDAEPTQRGVYIQGNQKKVKK